MRQAMLDAWTEIDEKYPDRAWWRRKGTHRGLMWEYTVKNAIDRLGPGVRVLAHNDTISLIFDEELLVRSKKADYELMTRNYPTLTASLFHDPEADLFGFTELPRVEVVYVPNKFETGIDWVGIAARENDRVIWSFEIEEAGHEAEMLPLETAAPAKSPADLAKLKKGTGKDVKRDGESE